LVLCWRCLDRGWVVAEIVGVVDRFAFINDISLWLNFMRWRTLI